MKKTTLLNSDISEIISKLGHTDIIVIGDAGLPIPKDVRRIDMALVKGVPSFNQVLEAVLSEMEVEEVTIASEMKDKNKELYKSIKERFKYIEIKEILHDEFKVKTKESAAIIRSGECSSYANIILRSGVIF